MGSIRLDILDEQPVRLKYSATAVLLIQVSVKYYQSAGTWRKTSASPQPVPVRDGSNSCIDYVPLLYKVLLSKTPVWYLEMWI